MRELSFILFSLLLIIAGCEPKPAPGTAEHLKKITAKIDDAALVQEPQATAALEARAAEDVKSTLITGQYLIDAERVDGKIRATLIRERIRTLGPSVRLDLGKQADGTAGAFAAVEG